MASPKSGRYHPVAQTESASLEDAVGEEITDRRQCNSLALFSIFLGVALFLIVGGVLVTLRMSLDKQNAPIRQVILAST